MASDGGRCGENTEARYYVGGRFPRRGEDHAQAAASQAGAVDGRVHTQWADVHHHRADGERITARVSAQAQWRRHWNHLRPHHWHGGTGDHNHNVDDDDGIDLAVQEFSAGLGS